METPSEKQVKLAFKCPHVDRPEKAKGMCQSCYRAAKKAEDIASGKIKINEETLKEASSNSPVEVDLVNDPAAVKRFYGIMWSWLEKANSAQEPIITVDKKGKSVRDFKLEARMQEASDQRGIKAAQILGRAYIAERVVEEKPADLGVDGMGDMMRGWNQVADMKGKKADA